MYGIHQGSLIKLCVMLSAYAISGKYVTASAFAYILTTHLCDRLQSLYLLLQAPDDSLLLLCLHLQLGTAQHKTQQQIQWLLKSQGKLYCESRSQRLTTCDDVLLSLGCNSFHRQCGEDKYTQV